MFQISMPWPEVNPNHLIVVGVYLLVAMALSFILKHELKRRRIKKILSLKQSSEWTVYMHETSKTNDILVFKYDHLHHPIVRGKYQRRSKGKYDLVAEEFSESVFFPEKEVRAIRKEIKKAFEVMIEGPRPDETTNTNIYIIKK